MLRSCLTLALVASLALAGCDGGSGKSAEPPPPAPELAYPETAKGPESDTYFGREVADPYRWLEDIRSQKTDNWVQAQNRFTAEYITALPDYRAIAKRLGPLFAPITAASPQSGRTRQTERREQGVQDADGNYYYQLKVQQERYHRRAPVGMPQFVSADNIIYVASSTNASGRGTALIDVNDFRVGPDDHIQLLEHQVSLDGKYLVYLMQRNFSDLVELHVVALQQPSRPIIRIPHVYSRAITLYGDGFIYSSPRGVKDPHVSPHTFHSLYYRPFLGAQSEVWLEGDEFEMIQGTFLHQDQLYIMVGTDMHSGLLRLDPAHPELGAHAFLDARADQRAFNYLDRSPEDPAKMLFITSDGADLHRLIEVDPADPSPGNWREILPLAGVNDTVYVSEIIACDDGYYAEHLDHGSSRLFHYGAAGAREIPLPSLGAVSHMECDDPDGEKGLYYVFSTLTQPAIGFVYNPATQASIQATVQRFEGYDPSLYEMRRLFATSPDGTQIPVYIAHKKGLRASGDVPVLIYSYGGFISPTMPRFDSKAIPLLESGGIYAVAQVRGGAEYGTAWYEAGRLLNKQKTYDDVIAVAEHLIGEGFTRPGKIALQGESNGGTTTAAVALQRPGLFGVVFPMVGVMDLVRYDKFTAGTAWHGDYGHNTDEAQFGNLMTFSPLHNVKPLSYPPMYVFTSKTDGRVMPGHSYKFAAALQNTATGTNPYLLYAFPKDSHSFDRYREAAITFMWTAFFHHTGSRYGGPAN